MSGHQGDSGLLRQRLGGLPLRQPSPHRRTKHTELDILFVRDQVTLSDVGVLHIPTKQQFADIMTKGLRTTFLRQQRRRLDCRGGVEYICYVHIVYYAHLLILYS